MFLYHSMQLAGIVFQACSFNRVVTDRSSATERLIQLRTSSSAACQLLASQVVDFIDLTELARRTGRFPQLAHL
jgi:hypothetical protein